MHARREAIVLVVVPASEAVRPSIDWILPVRS
jgi:hypothetical protein